MPWDEESWFWGAGITILDLKFESLIVYWESKSDFELGENNLHHMGTDGAH